MNSAIPVTTVNVILQRAELANFHLRPPPMKMVSKLEADGCQQHETLNTNYTLYTITLFGGMVD